MRSVDFGTSQSRSLSTTRFEGTVALLRYDAEMKKMIFVHVVPTPFDLQFWRTAMVAMAFAVVPAISSLNRATAATPKPPVLPPLDIVAAPKLFPDPLSAALQIPPPQVSTEQALYQFLIAEIAGQRGRTQFAARGMLDLATRTRDARIARRAAEIAFQARETAEARDALLLWLDLEPETLLAKQALGALVGAQGPAENVVETLTQWLGEKDAEKKYAPVLFMQIPYLLARYPDRQKTAVTVAKLALTFPHLAEALYAQGVTAMFAGSRGSALAQLDSALKLRPNFARAAIAKAQLMRGEGSGDKNGNSTVGETDTDAEAANFLEQFLKANPASTDVRIAYARLLVGMRSLLAAREAFRRAAGELPLDPELPYAVGLISLQIEDWAEAEKQFGRTLELLPRDRNPIYFNLALAAEGKKDIDRAITWYRQINQGEYFVSAQLKIANYLAKREGFDAGRSFLREAQKVQSTDTDSPEISTQLVLAEVQMLRELGEQKALTEAYQVLTQALTKQPESIEFLYDRAMVAERVGSVDSMEKDLRKVIKIKPDHAHAYNALGYSFAERGIRLDEAYQLIQTAQSLAPGDPFIQDSLGWVQFRMGRPGEALVTLEKAYAARSDPEIAAHLGEIMWSVGNQTAAMAIWQKALKEFPGNAVLAAVVRRFTR